MRKYSATALDILDTLQTGGAMTAAQIADDIGANSPHAARSVLRTLCSRKATHPSSTSPRLYSITHHGRVVLVRVSPGHYPKAAK